MLAIFYYRIWPFEFVVNIHSDVGRCRESFRVYSTQHTLDLNSFFKGELVWRISSINFTRLIFNRKLPPFPPALQRWCLRNKKIFTGFWQLLWSKHQSMELSRRSWIYREHSLLDRHTFLADCLPQNTAWNLSIQICPGTLRNQITGATVQNMKVIENKALKKWVCSSRWLPAQYEMVQTAVSLDRPAKMIQSYLKNRIE